MIPRCKSAELVRVGLSKLKATAVLLFFCLATGMAQAQMKYEKESRVKSSEVPDAAVEFVESASLNVKQKWYREQSQDGESYEVKFLHEGERYSIEFGREGQWEDIEILMPWKQAPEATRDSVCEFLHSEWDKFKISRSQIQYTGEVGDLAYFLSLSSPSSSLKVKYELVVKCYLDKEVFQYEYLFDRDGTALWRSEVIFENASNLEY